MFCCCCCCIAANANGANSIDIGKEAFVKFDNKLSKNVDGDNNVDENGGIGGGGGGGRCPALLFRL